MRKKTVVKEEVEIILDERLFRFDWSYKKEKYKETLKSISYDRMDDITDISVIIISNNISEEVLQNVRVLHSQKKNLDFELIFVNNGDQSIFKDKIKDFSDMYIELYSNVGAYRARNIGALFSQSDILCFIDDDGTVDHDIIAAHLIAHELYHPYSVSGICLPKTDNVNNSKANHYYKGSNPGQYFVDLEGNCSYNSDMFFKAGGWNDDIFFGHGGKELSIRIRRIDPDRSKQIYFPYAILFHDYARNSEHLKNKRQRQEESESNLSSIYPEWKYFYKGWIAPVNMDLPEMTEEKNNILHEIWHRNRKSIKGFSEQIYTDFPMFDNKSNIEIFKKKVSEKQIIIFGAGKRSELCIDFLSGFGIDIDFLTDNDEKKWGRSMNGFNIAQPEINKNNHFVYIIASSWKREIAEQLERKGLLHKKDYWIY